MGYEKIATAITEFERLCRQLSINVAPHCPFGRNLALVKDFLVDLGANPEKTIEQWTQRPFDDWYWAMLSVEKVASAVSELRNHPDDLKKLVPLAVMEDIRQDFEPSQSKTYLYELQVGAWFQRAGFVVSFVEPDVRLSGNGLSQELGIACKYPSSKKNSKTESPRVTTKSKGKELPDWSQWGWTSSVAVG